MDKCKCWCHDKRQHSCCDYTETDKEEGMRLKGLPDWYEKYLSSEKQIKSLESRLKEAQEENKVWTEASKDWAVIGQRLSQAEAERDKLKQKEVDKKYCCENPLNSKHYGPCVEIDNATVARQEKIIHDLQERLAEAEDCRNAFAKDHAEIDARLSHLMDVAGKMAGALEPFSQEPHERKGHGIVSHEFYHEVKMEHFAKAKLALASWQDFNNKQKGE